MGRRSHSRPGKGPTPYLFVGFAVSVALFGIGVAVIGGSSALPTPARVAAVALFLDFVELGILPDFIARFGMRRLHQERLDSEALHTHGVSEHDHVVQVFAEDLRSRGIMETPPDGSERDTEVAPGLYELIHGARGKHSAAFFPNDGAIWRSEASSLLDEAEERMLALYAERLRLDKSSPPMRVLDLGCGRGSATIWIAEHFPQLEVVGFASTWKQQSHVMEEAKARNLNNVQVIKADFADIGEGSSWTSDPLITPLFDRVLAIEVFEEMKNLERVLERVATRLLKPSGLLLVQSRAHDTSPYHFEDRNHWDWLTKNFLVGYVMPSADLLPRFQKDLSLVTQWRVSGMHYAMTYEAWLQRLDAAGEKAIPPLEWTYGKGWNADRWRRRWRGLLMYFAELYAWNRGNEWYVMQYLLERPSSAGAAAPGANVGPGGQGPDPADSEL